MTFAEKLQQARKTAGLSQEDLAEACHVSRQSVSKWENGGAYPEVETLVVIAKRLNASLDELLLDKAPPSPTAARPAVGSIMIRTQDGTSLVRCLQVKPSPIAMPRPDEPKYILFAVTGTGFFGEQTTNLGWYADEESLKKEVAAIAAAMERGAASYELQYAAKVKVKLFSVKLENDVP